VASERNLESDNRDRTGAFFVAALLITGMSYVVIVLSVHTYCENRPFAVAIAIAALINGFLLLRNSPSTSLRRILLASGLVPCLVAVAGNVWFVIWATQAHVRPFEVA